MDPDRTLTLASEAMDAGDLEAAQEYLAAYRLWRNRAGFSPPDGDRRETALRLRMADLLAESDAEFRGHKIRVLRRIFARMAPPDWQGPMTIEVRAGPLADQLVRQVVAAVAYFTGMLAKVQTIRDANGTVERYAITTPGYRAATGQPGE
jgi:hypothetical protein